MRVLLTCFIVFLAGAVIRAEDDESEISSFESQSSSISQSTGDNGPGQHSQSSINVQSQSSSSNSGGKGSNDPGPLPTISSSGSSVKVTQKCTNGECMTCINENCFKSGNYTAVKAISGCPVCVCTHACNQMVTASDGCPICNCNNGNGVREPCQANSDCPKNSTGCSENACKYSGVPNDLPRSCSYAYECPASEDCEKGSCIPSKSGKHLEGQLCTFDNDCPSKYACRDKTCWDNGEVHLKRRHCAFDFNCPSGYQCKEQTCYKTGVEHSDYSCVFNSQCDDGMRCDTSRMTCYPE